MQVKLGDKNIPFIYQGDELLYPNAIKDGLVLYYDMKGMSNNSQYKDILKDLSGNNSDAILKNFNYTNESGYSDKGLKFDGVDDYISSLGSINRKSKDITIEICLDDIDKSTNWQYLVSLKDENNNFISILIHYSKIDVNISNSIDGKHVYYGLDDDTKHITVVLPSKENSNTSVYTNGKETFGSTDRESIASTISVMNNELVFNSYQRKTNKTAMKSLKIYDRTLTEEEIQHNYKIEKERWGL